jgi:hypothetical protein
MDGKCIRCGDRMKVPVAQQCRLTGCAEEPHGVQG